MTLTSKINSIVDFTHFIISYHRCAAIHITVGWSGLWWGWTAVRKANLTVISVDIMWGFEDSE